MRHIIFLINPISGTGDKKNLADLIRKMCRGAAEISFEETNILGDYKWLQEKVKNEKITDIVVCGGDGSINQVAAHFVHSTVNIGIIPLGSGNGLAFTANIPANVTKALEIIVRNKPKPIDAFTINDKFSCHLCGIGFDAQVAHDFAKSKKRGLATYIKQTVLEYMRCEAYPFEIILDNKKISRDSFFISIANSNQFGNHFKIAPAANLSDGKLDVVIVQKMNKVKMLGAILHQIRNGKVVEYDQLNKKDILYVQAKQLEIRNEKLAPLHIDGEPSPTSTVFSIKIIEKAFNLLQPSA